MSGRKPGPRRRMDAPYQGNLAWKSSDLRVGGVARLTAAQLQRHQTAPHGGMTLGGLDRCLSSVDQEAWRAEGGRAMMALQ